LAPLLVVAVVLVALTGCAKRIDGSAESIAARPVPSALRAYRDPVTGVFGPPLRSATLPNAASKTATVPRAPLQESAAPGGGRMVHLHGGFRSHVIAARSARGTAVSCAAGSR
jgi:hypothetical protein